MSLEILNNYKSFIVDYSFIRQFAGSRILPEFLDLVTSERKDVYVSRSFKLLHYCVIHQADDKTSAVTNAMRDFCSMLLPDKLLHSVQISEIGQFLNKMSLVQDGCLIMSSKGILIKRLREKRPVFLGDICVFGEDGEPSIYHSISELLEDIKEEPLSPLASSDKYLDVPVYCNVGDVVTTGKGDKVVLDKRVSAGAEGMVFTTDNPKVVAKIYHKGIITPLRWKKLQTQVEMGINSLGICWPRDLLFYKGIPVGYTMIMGKGKTLGNVFDGPDALLNSFPECTRLDIVTTLCDLLEKYLYLHMFDIVAGDIQMKNALIYSPNSIFLIDMDSVQVGNLPCPVGTEEFTDPRLWGKDFSGFLRKLEDEDYSIAMLVFSLLFCGLHPYATRNGAETLREEILGKNFPYSLDDAEGDHIPKGGYNYIWEYLPDNLKQMLYKTFHDGESFEAIEWYDAVTVYKDSLSSREYEDEQAYKAFPKMDYVATDPHPISKPRFTPPVKKKAPDGVFAPPRTTQPAASVNRRPENDGQSALARRMMASSGSNAPEQEEKKEDPPGGRNEGGLFGLFKNRR
ncbi:MAG: hypothetical protein IJ757_03710 [Clostridiales bacterium]|nr:hypothetical protein [Clostridiales bacterium]